MVCWNILNNIEAEYQGLFVIHCKNSWSMSSFPGGRNVSNKWTMRNTRLPNYLGHQLIPCHRILVKMMDRQDGESSDNEQLIHACQAGNCHNLRKGLNLHRTFSRRSIWYEKWTLFRQVEAAEVVDCNIELQFTINVKLLWIQILTIWKLYENY